MALKSSRIKAAPLDFLELLRWGWRQLTSMRTALFLLLLLAVAAVPGSLYPQRSSNPNAVIQYIEANPEPSKWLEKLQLFDVYTSAWFSSIYLLLFVSLIGCIVPRIKQHYKTIRQAPPRTPQHLNRMPQYRNFELAPQDKTLAQKLALAENVLKTKGYRTEVRDDSVGAEKGYVREIGNLLFHTPLVGVLASIAMSGLWGYNGQKVIVEGQTFVNTLSSYDSFSPGAYFKPENLDEYSVTLNKFNVTYDLQSPNHIGQPIDFTANVTTKNGPQGQEQQQVLKVNEPLRMGDTNLYLVGNGYAPVVTVKDGTSKVVFSQPVTSLPTDPNNTSTVVIKVPDAKPDQLAFLGFLLPTTAKGDNGISFSEFPDLIDPTLNLDSYHGDLGLDGGAAQNVFSLDTSKLTQLNGRKLPAGAIVLKPGQTHTLPDGKGSITLDKIVRYIGVDIHHDPGQIPVLVTSALAFIGLIISLFTPRRRAWVRVNGQQVELGLLTRGEDFRLAAEADDLQTTLQEKM